MINLLSKSNEFWQRYSKKDLSKNSLMNLEIDELESIKKFEAEKKRVLDVVKFTKSGILIDLGGGVGLWSQFFSSRVKKVILVEKQRNFCSIAKENIKENNIIIVESDVVDFDYPINSCDFVFISGVTIYLDDESLNLLMNKISGYLKKDGLLIHRDAYGTRERFILNEKYSEKLNSNYSAIYRTRKEYDKIICDFNNFIKKYDEDMYKFNPDLNKWDETRLRLAVYKNK